MLQCRLFSYSDAQRYRLGVNHWQIPVHYSKNARNFHRYHRDGAMRIYESIREEEFLVLLTVMVNGRFKNIEKRALELTGGTDFYNFCDDDENDDEQ